MRTAVIGLVTIPVLVVGGLGIAAAVGVIDDQRTETAHASGAPSVPSASGTASQPHTFTAIDGRRPHLTVVNGHHTLMPPGALPAILSTLSHRNADLSALPPVDPQLAHGRADIDRYAPSSAPLSDPPAPGSIEVSTSAPPTQNPGAQNGWVAPIVPTLRPSNPTTDGTTTDRPPEFAPNREGDTRSDREDEVRPDIDIATGRATGGTSDRDNRPPHADTTGRPPHAGKPGRPDHADKTGRPDHADKTGRPDHAGKTGRPDHADDNGRPPHAFGTGKLTGLPDHAGEGDRGPRAGGFTIVPDDGLKVVKKPVGPDDGIKLALKENTDESDPADTTGPADEKIREDVTDVADPVDGTSDPDLTEPTGVTPGEDRSGTVDRSAEDRRSTAG